LVTYGMRAVLVLLLLALKRYWPCWRTSTFNASSWLIYNLLYSLFFQFTKN
jgi:hypothetical protein